MIGWILLFAVCVGLLRGVDLFQSFARGAWEGMQSAVRVAPYLAATMAAVNILRTSGFPERVFSLFSPVTERLGVSPEILSIIFMRPLSGAASLGMLKEVLLKSGPDSKTGLIASTMMASGETVLYTCAVYLSAAGVKKSGYIIPVALIGWGVGCVISVLLFMHSP